MPGLNFDVDPDGLLEYSVVFTDRSLNHMSASFQDVMLGISSTLEEVYRAHSVALVPGVVRTAWKPWRGSSPMTNTR